LANAIKRAVFVWGRLDESIAARAASMRAGSAVMMGFGAASGGAFFGQGWGILCSLAIDASGYLPFPGIQ